MPRDLERRRPRPVADVPAADPAAVAKLWLLELVRGAPLADAGRLPAASIAADGPALAAMLLDGLRSDAALEDLAALATRAAALTDAGDAAGVVRAVEALRAAAWSVLARELDEDLAAPAADRLAHLCALVLESALAGAAQGAGEPEPDPAPTAGGPRGGPLADALTAAAPPMAAAPGVPPFEAAILRRVAAYERDGRPFTVLLVEVDDAERLVASGGEDALSHGEDAVAAALRPADLLTRESPGRLWVTAPDTAGIAARDLAGRLAGAVPGAAALHGVSLRASVGVATCPEDGTDVESLVARADEQLFAARAAGLPLV